MFSQSLQAKVFLTFLLFMGAMTVFLLMNQRLVLLPVFTKLEEEFVARDLERVIQTLKQEQSALESTLFDWSAWDDTYEFIVNQDTGYEAANLDFSTIENLRMNLMLFYNRDGHLVWGRGFNLETAEDLEFPEFMGDADPHLKSLFWFPDDAASEALRSGVLRTRQGILLVASRPILNSGREGPWRGVLIMGRMLAGDSLDRLQRAAGVQFDLVLADQVDGEVTRALAGEKICIRRIDDARLEAFRPLMDLSGQPTLLIRNQISREIFNVAFQSLRKSFWMVVLGLLTLMVALMAMVHVEVTRPVAELSRHLGNLRKSGNYNRPFKYRAKDEVGRLAQRFNELLAQIAAHSNELRDLSYEDSLTQVANRRCFNDRLALRWEEASHTGRTMALILCDIDYFKRFNDLYGHLVGDECLREVAQTLKRVVNKKLDLVSRFGGEEFVILLPETSLEEALGVAERIAQAIAELCIEHARSPVSRYVTLSMGVSACVPTTDLSPESLLRAADVALYQAKELGRNRVQAAGGGEPQQQVSL